MALLDEVLDIFLELVEVFGVMLEILVILTQLSETLLYKGVFVSGGDREKNISLNLAQNVGPRYLQE